MCLTSDGASPAVTDIVGEKTCVFETAATVIALGDEPGEPMEPVPNWSRSLPAEITGTTPAAVTFLDHVDHRVVRRFGLGAAAREVDDVHAVTHGELEGRGDLGCVGDVADRGRHVEDAVVPDVRARRDTRQAARRRMVGTAGRAGPGVAGCDAGDMRRVEGGGAIDR